MFSHNIYRCEYFIKRPKFPKCLGNYSLEKEECIFTKKESAHLFLRRLAKESIRARVYVYYFNNITTEYYLADDYWIWNTEIDTLEIKNLS